MQNQRLTLAVVFGLAIFASNSQAATWTWSGALGTATWDTDGQWTTPGAPNFVDIGTNPGDNLIFDTSSQTTVNMRPTTSGTGNLEDKVLNLTFNSNAPAYTFVSTTSDHDVNLYGSMINNSGVIQTFSTGLAINGAVVTGATGDIGTNYAFEFGDHIWLAGSGGAKYNGPFDIHVSGTGPAALQALNVTINNAKIVVEGGMTTSGTYTVDGNGTVILNGAWNPSSSSTAVVKQGTGTLILNGASNNTARPWTISNGIVRAGNNLAMGNTTRALRTSGGSGNFGTLELYNNITLEKNITIDARQGAAAAAVAVQNYSGNNTISGNITLSTGGGQYNIGAINAGEKLTFTGNVGVSTGAAGTRNLTIRGAGDVEFSGSGFGHNQSASNSNMPVHHYGTGNVILKSSNAYRLGHIIAYNGGTITLGNSFANNDVPADYPLFAPSDDHPTPNPIRIQLLNNSKIDVSQAANLYVPTTSSVGLNRTIAGTGTVIGNIMTIPADSANTSNGYRNSDPNGKAAFKPGNIVNIDPADPTGINLVSNDDSLGQSTFGGGIGQLTIQGDLDMATGASSDDLQWHLGAFKDQSMGVAGTDWDLLAVTGDVKLDTADTITIGSFTVGAASGPDAAVPDAFWNASHNWKILDAATNSSGSAIPGFTVGTVTHYAASGSFTGGDFELSLGNGADAGDLFLEWTALPALSGDFDGDGDVDGADFIVWQTNFPTSSGATLGQGDADGDTDVDGADFAAWQSGFPTSPSPGASPVPEPTGCILLSLGGIALVLRNRRRLKS